MNKQKVVIGIFIFLALVSFYTCSKDSMNVTVRKDWASLDESERFLNVEYAVAMWYENCKQIDGRVVLAVDRQGWIDNGFPEADYEGFKQIVIRYSIGIDSLRQKILDGRLNMDLSELWDFQKDQDEYFARRRREMYQQP